MPPGIAVSVTIERRERNSSVQRRQSFVLESILLKGDQVSYLGSMKQKTSITLSPETIRAVDEVAGKTSNRSRVIEEAVLEFLARRKRQIREARDLEILDAAADELNREVEEVLDYQAEL